VQTSTQWSEDPLLVDGAAQVVLGVSDEEDVACSFWFTVVLLGAGVFSCWSIGLPPISQRRWLSPEQKGDMS